MAEYTEDIDGNIDDSIEDILEELPEGYELVMNSDTVAVFTDAPHREVYFSCDTFGCGHACVRRTSQFLMTVVETDTGRVVTRGAKGVIFLENGIYCLEMPGGGYSGKTVSVYGADGRRVLGNLEYIDHYANMDDNIYIVGTEEYKSFGFIDVNDLREPDEWYDNIDSHNCPTDAYAVVGKGGMEAFLGSDGKRIGNWYGYITRYMGTYGTVTVGLCDKLAMVNRDSVRITGWYDRIDSYSDGFARVCRDGKWTFLDGSGKEMFGWHDDARGFNDGAAAVKDGGEWRGIRTNGSVIDGYTCTNESASFRVPSFTEFIG